MVFSYFYILLRVLPNDINTLLSFSEYFTTVLVESPLIDDGCGP